MHETEESDCRTLREAVEKFETGFCLNCRIESCYYDNKPRVVQEAMLANVVMQCNHCKELSTVSFVGSTLGTTSRYLQMGNKVYHLTICGVAKPIGNTF